MQSKRQERGALLLEIIKGNLSTTTRALLNVGKALSEIKQNRFYLLWGYSSFYEWLECSEFELKRRKCQYLIRIVETCHKLGIALDRVEPLGIAKLRAIMSLNVKKHEALMLELLNKAPKMSLSELEAAGGRTLNIRQLAKTVSFNEEQLKIVSLAVDKLRVDSPRLPYNEAIAQICKDFVG